MTDGAYLYERSQELLDGLHIPPSYPAILGTFIPSKVSPCLCDSEHEIRAVRDLNYARCDGARRRQANTNEVRRHWQDVRVGQTYLADRQRLGASDGVVYAVDREAGYLDTLNNPARADLRVVIPSVLEPIHRRSD